jgi:hypothetical protein
MIIPVEVSPEEWEFVKVSAEQLDQMRESTDWVMGDVAAIAVSSMLAGLGELFDKVRDTIPEVRYVKIVTIINYDNCNNETCYIFWHQLKRTTGYKSQHVYTKGAFQPELGYGGKSEAAEHLAEALAAAREAFDEE